MIMAYDGNGNLVVYVSHVWFTNSVFNYDTQ